MFYWKTTKYGTSMLRLMPRHIPVIVQPEKTYRHKARNILPIVAAVWSAAFSSTLTENDWSTKKYSHNQSFNSALKRRSGAIFLNRLLMLEIRATREFCFCQLGKGTSGQKVVMPGEVAKLTHTPVWPHLCAPTYRFRLHKNSKANAGWNLSLGY